MFRIVRTDYVPQQIKWNVNQWENSLSLFHIARTTYMWEQCSSTCISEQSPWFISSLQSLVLLSEMTEIIYLILLWNHFIPFILLCPRFSSDCFQVTVFKWLFSSEQLGAFCSFNSSGVTPPVIGLDHCRQSKACRRGMASDFWFASWLSALHLQGSPNRMTRITLSPSAALDTLCY